MNVARTKCMIKSWLCAYDGINNAAEFFEHGWSVQLPKIRQKTGQDTAKDAKNGKWSSYTFVLHLHYIPETKKRRAQYMMPCSWKSGSPEKGQLWRNGRVTACLADSFLWPGLLAMFGLAGTVSTPLLDVTVTVLVLWTFCLTHSMHHSERCKVSSETVVSVTIQRMFFRNL